MRRLLPRHCSVYCLAVGGVPTVLSLWSDVKRFTATGYKPITVVGASHKLLLQHNTTQSLGTKELLWLRVCVVFVKESPPPRTRVHKVIMNVLNSKCKFCNLIGQMRCLNHLDTSLHIPVGFLRETLRPLVVPSFCSGRHSLMHAFGFLNCVDPLVLVPTIYMITEIE